MPTKLPPGISAGIFATAIGEFRNAVGADWVFTSEDDLDTYRDAYSIRWGNDDEYLASAAVAPKTVEEVQAVVRVANKYKIPLYPISTGKNLTYGGSAPTYSGSIVVDLKRMNRVLEVDDKRNFAIVEPGCSYFDLYQYIKARGLKVWIDCPDPGWGSPIGNALDHGVGYTASPFRDHWGSHCGMEVVTPTGDVMRTGMGASPTSDTWAEYKYGVGPHVDGLFAQGNFGIVTKMGFWLMPQPEAWLAGTIAVPRFGDFGPLIDHVNYLEDAHLATGQVSYSSPHGGNPANNPALRALMADGWPSTERIESFVTQAGQPAWRVRLQFYGPESAIRASWEYAKRRIGQSIVGATFVEEELLEMPLTPAQEKTHHLVHFGIPNMAVFAMMSRTANSPPNPYDGHSDFIAVASRTAESVLASSEALYEAQKEMGLEITSHPFRTPITWFHKAFLVSVGAVWTSRDDPDGNKKARAEYEGLLVRMAAAGFTPYRTNPSSHALLIEQFSFNNNALLKFQEALKDGIDPNGILAPGRYGIWPKRLRPSRA